MAILNMVVLIVLIFATAFFVATEFAIVRLRASRVEQMVLEGKKGALAAQKVTANLDGYLSACQLGITITALGLGWIGEPTVERLLHPAFEALSLPASVSKVLTFLLAFFMITYLHVVVGELAPKTIAIQKAEQVVLLFARPLILFYKIMYPVIWVMNGSGLQLVKWLGLKPAKDSEEAHSEEELRIILSESYRSGKINQTEYGYVNRIFTFDELLAREIMVPRTDMVCLYKENTLEENMRIAKNGRFTRYPVVSGSKDLVVGMINVKELFLAMAEQKKEADLASLVHPVLTVPETIPVNRLLRKMQQSRNHLAILVDEYGGTSGMVTIEDILEEIVGDIRDEFDDEEPMEVEKIGEGVYRIDGRVTIERVNELFHADLDNEELDTIGGWLYAQNPDLAEGDTCHEGGLSFTIEQRDGHRIRQVIIRRQETEQPDPDGQKGKGRNPDGEGKADHKLDEREAGEGNH